MSRNFPSVSEAYLDSGTKILLFSSNHYMIKIRCKVLQVVLGNYSSQWKVCNLESIRIDFFSTASLLFTVTRIFVTIIKLVIIHSFMAVIVVKADGDCTFFKQPLKNILGRSFSLLTS